MSLHENADWLLAAQELARAQGVQLHRHVINTLGTAAAIEGLAPFGAHEVPATAPSRYWLEELNLLLERDLTPPPGLSITPQPDRQWLIEATPKYQPCPFLDDYRKRICHYLGHLDLTSNASAFACWATCNAVMRGEPDLKHKARETIAKSGETASALTVTNAFRQTAQLISSFASAKQNRWLQRAIRILNECEGAGSSQELLPRFGL